MRFKKGDVIRKTYSGELAIVLSVEKETLFQRFNVQSLIKGRITREHHSCISAPNMTEVVLDALLFYVMYPPKRYKGLRYMVMYRDTVRVGCQDIPIDSAIKLAKDILEIYGD